MLSDKLEDIRSAAVGIIVTCFITGGKYVQADKNITGQNKTASISSKTKLKCT